MKFKLPFFIVFIAFCFFTTPAQETVPVGSKELEFVIANNFKLISRNEEITSNTYSNESKTVFIEVFVPGIQLVPEDLEKHKSMAIGFAELASPDLKWLEREIKTYGGRKWIYLSYEVKGQNNDTMRFDSYTASIELSLVSVTFASKISGYEGYKKMQHEIIKSFKLCPKTALINH